MEKQWTSVVFQEGFPMIQPMISTLIERVNDLTKAETATLAFLIALVRLWSP